MFVYVAAIVFCLFLALRFTYGQYKKYKAEKEWDDFLRYCFYAKPDEEIPND